MAVFFVGTSITVGIPILFRPHIDDSVQECGISIAYALEIPQPCTELAINM